MVRRDVTRVSERLRFVWLWVEGKSLRAIARETGVGATTVSRWIRRWLHEGHVHLRQHIRKETHIFGECCGVTVSEFQMMMMMAFLVFLTPLIIIIILASVYTPVVAAVTLLPRGDGKLGWEAVGAVLTSPSLPPSPPHCSLAFITHNNNISTSTSIIQKGSDLSVSLGVSVFEVTTMKGQDNNNNNNLTQTHLTRVVSQARQVRVGSWCVSVVVVSRDVELLNSLAHEIREGRLLQWDTRLVVVTQLDLHTLTHLLHTHWTFAMMNTLMLNKENSSFHGASFPVSVDEESMPLFGVVRKTVQTTTTTTTTGNNNNNNSSNTSNNINNTTNNNSSNNTSNTTTTTTTNTNKNNNNINNNNSLITFKGRDYKMLLAVGEALHFTPVITLTTSVTQVFVN
ncbi:hypothetical protein Pmani_033976 [Petrolisthes manimaculis]|uniref:Uncharacterized protein n=1 Tax=Petrolisthes manimaculis TaxID=1843537 RepID=A0AAE1TS58_9EUCA|nr:hypothetical protein Pmani_033976 [Petrolisthes manimaculis]